MDSIFDGDESESHALYSLHCTYLMRFLFKLLLLPLPSHSIKNKNRNWNCIINSYSTHTHTPYSLISLSKHITTVHSLLQFHAITITTGNSTNPFIASKLISLYDPSSATTLFLSLSPSSADTFLWNSIIKSHFSHAHYPTALQFYSLMRNSNVLPNHFTVPMVASSCAHLMMVQYGVTLHGLASKTGLFICSSAVGSSFVSMYSRCGQMKEASLVFDEMLVRDVVAWTALVVGYVHNGEGEKGLGCLREIMHHGVGEGVDHVRPNSRTLEGGFLACGDLGALSEGRCLHGFVVKTGIGCEHVVQSSLLSMYCKCAVLEEARQSFFEVRDKDLVAWTSIIGVYARFGMVNECMKLFWEMQEKGIDPDGIVIGCILSGFGNSVNLLDAKAFHGLIIRRHYVADDVVGNSLLFMYCKLAMLSFAEKLFCECQQSKECWNFMVYAYSRVGKNVKCLELFRGVQSLGIDSETVSIVSAIASCGMLGEINLGRSIHGNVVKGILDDNVSVGNSLIEMYGKCDKMAYAWKLFKRMEKDVISWNTLISAHIHVKDHEEAINLFHKMIMEGHKPNTATFVVVLSACSYLAYLVKGERVHDYINENGFKLNLPLGTALVDMYAKCGQLEKSREVFDSMKEKDIICWNAMISGYGMNGYAESALEIFQHMEESNVKPNGITFLVLLSACAHAGFVEEGKCLFAKMQSYCVKPNLKHYTCMVDILGRSGNLQEAEALVLSMPIPPDGGVWGALLSACKTYNQVEMGIRVAKYAIDSEPENDGYYIMMANMYSSIGRWEEAENVRRTMKERCSLGKKAGWSVL